MNNGRFSMPFNERKLFWLNLDKIRDILVLSDAQFAQYIGINYSEYTKSKSTHTFLPLDCVFELSEKLNFHFVDLFNPDFKLLYNTGNEQVSERYTIAPYSSLNPTLNILSYLEKTRGTRAKINTLRKLQLSENYILNTQNKTNINLINDTVHYLAETYQFSDDEFLSMGKQTPFSQLGNIIGPQLNGPEKDVVDVLETFVYECTPLFDTNCDYKLTEVRDNYAIMAGFPKKDVLEELKSLPSTFGNEKVCLTKMGCLSSFSWFQYNRYAEVKKIASTNDGHSSNEYLIDLTQFKKLDSSSSATVLDFKSVNH